MGLGYVFMMFASQEASTEAFGKAAMVWIFLAYLFHTIGELCTSPVALSFITKLAPLKYASIMMGVYFAATGFGNKLAGSIGEASQLEAYSTEMVVDKSTILPYMTKDSIEIKDTNNKIVKVFDYPINEDKNFSIKSFVYPMGDEVVFESIEDGEKVNRLFAFAGEDEAEKQEQKGRLLESLTENGVTKDSPYHARLTFEKNKDAAQAIENKGDGNNYEMSFVLEEEQSEQEYKTFMWLVIFTVTFGFLLMLFLKKLKKLTHGAEDNEVEKLEAENYEIADEDIN